MTYWIVISMIFVAILAVALASGLAPDADDGAVADDDAPLVEEATTHDHR
jgi:hypothetical protein